MLDQIDDTFHAKARLGIVSLLVMEGEKDFSSLKKALGLTDGNLGNHIRVLEEKHYIKVKKKFIGKKPKTTCSMTAAGKQAFSIYLSHLTALIEQVKEGQ